MIFILWNMINGKSCQLAISIIFYSILIYFKSIFSFFDRFFNELVLSCSGMFPSWLSRLLCDMEIGKISINRR